MAKIPPSSAECYSVLQDTLVDFSPISVEWLSTLPLFFHLVQEQQILTI